MGQRPLTGNNPCAQPLENWWQHHAASLEPSAFIGVAYSGGADSTALLLAAKALWGERVVALHVNHGLQAAAQAFEQHGLAFCQTHAIAWRVERLQVAVAPGQSVEEQARLARYHALAKLAASADACGVVLLAQHAQDQLETILIALSRGAGLPGLSAMASDFMRYAQRFVRPILAVQAGDIRTWLAQSGHGFVDDPSNADTSLTRNRIRAQVLPALEQALPGIAQAAARSAAHAAQAQRVLVASALADAHSVGLPPNILALQQLVTRSEAQGVNLLRYWLSHTPGATPSAAQLRELMQQIKACTTRGHRIHIKVGAGHVQRSGDQLVFCAPII
jgi:tRNA(Ile)-lysidine synthase